MRTLAALVLSSLVLLGGCAATLPSANSSCELAAVPTGAVFGVREGVDTATYPSQIPDNLTGCQRVWYGERSRPEGMQVLATYYFDKGHVRRLVGQVPNGQAYDCHYRNGALDGADSRNAQLCPAASRVDQLPLTRP
ncbi:MAG: hypothetical protein ACJ8GO_00545 [Ramlibacter sp.]